MTQGGPPGGPAPRRRRTGLVVGLVVGGVLLLVGLGVGTLALLGWLLTREGDAGVGAPTVTRVEHQVVPPSTGPHLASPVYPASPYTDSPEPNAL